MQFFDDFLLRFIEIGLTKVFSGIEDTLFGYKYIKEHSDILLSSRYTDPFSFVDDPSFID